MGALADRMLELHFGGAKILFDKALEKGARIIEQAPSPKSNKELDLRLEAPHVQSDDVFPPANLDRFVLRGNYGPGKSKSAIHILAALDDIENLLFEIADQIGVDAADASSVMHVLITKKKIPKSYLALYDALREARNVIAHTQALPDKTEAHEYLRQASFLKSALVGVKNSLGGNDDL